jgi:UDP-GlcNAc:undecaprenyl-phosphate GlcNAc-1-phosphate transferase
VNAANLPAGAVSLAGWFLAALALSAALVPLCRTLAVRHGFVARPRADRWHRRPTALFGGVGIAVTVFVLAPIGGDIRALALLLAGGALIFIVGVTDDILSLKPSTKLIAEIVLASAFVLFDGRLRWSEMPAVDMLLTLVWLVGVTNAFNLLDNMDGLCAGVALIAGFALLMGVVGRPDVLVQTRYLAIVLGATAGFLIYNKHPASIFMGDAGSLFLGLTLAALTVTIGGPAHDRSRVLSVVVAPMLVLLIPIFDTTLVTILRLLSGRPLSQGGRDHSSHRLVAIGLPEKSAVRVLWALAAAGGVIAFLVRRFTDDRAWLVGAVFILAMVVFAVYLAQVRVYATPAALPAGRVTPMLITFMYKRRVAEVLLDVCLVAIAYYGAWRLRFEGPEWQWYIPSLLASLPIALAVQMVALFVFGAYRGAWRYFGLMDGVVFGKAVAAGTTCIIVAIVFLYRFDNYSRGVFVIYAALVMLLLCGSRASFRLIGEFANRRRTGTRLAIYGAGEAAPLVLRELLGRRVEHYRMIGFIDDDPATHSLRLQGYPVLGGERTLRNLIDQSKVDVVVIGARNIALDRFRRIEEACRARGVRLLRFTLHLETLVSPVPARAAAADTAPGHVEPAVPHDIPVPR